jgi:hypothetical protein
VQEQVRNERGRELLESIGARLERSPTVSTGDRRQLVLQTALADDTAKLGEAPDPMPRWLGNILAWVIEKVCMHVTPASRTVPASTQSLCGYAQVQSKHVYHMLV